MNDRGVGKTREVPHETCVILTPAACLDLDFRKAWLFLTDNTVIQVDPDNGGDFKCEQIHKLVECETFEMIRIKVNGRQLLMLLDEEGKVHGREVNSNATFLSGLYPHDVILGHAIVCRQNQLL